MIQGLVQLFIFQTLGELVSKFALPFIPGPVLGLVLLLAYLSVRGHVPASIDWVGGSVLQHLGLLFIPHSRVGRRGGFEACSQTQPFS
ncbi:CidA/LrgA family protein [Limnohabitans sp.]|uniref:CidA/LrgA family protein n=1 Tax=Limnohabitans sp. TaxID=1907725 RepID=UPI00286F0E9B|nr:CidA/LrgA family protein [Limnohabitans sp.]